MPIVNVLKNFFRLESYFSGRKNIIESDRKALFIHVPKTAGTSFRYSLSQKNKVCLDYGKHNRTTAKLIKREVYQKSDMLEAYDQFMCSDYTWLCGHIHLGKYLNWFLVSDIVVFLRDPLSQAISHYNHFVRHHGYTDSFSTFYKSDSFKNIQSKYLAALPVELIGVVAITENFQNSLEVLNRHFLSQYNEEEVNVAPSKIIKSEFIDNDEIESFKKLFKPDLDLYSRAQALLDQRMGVEQSGYEWCYAKLSLNKNLVLSGCAFHKKSKKCVVLEIYINNAYYKDVSANGFFAHYPKANFPRKRYVNVRLPLGQVIKEGDHIEVYVKETGQKITVEK